MKAVTIDLRFANYILENSCKLSAKWRIKISKILGAFLLVLLCFSGSRWNVHTPMVGSLLFWSGCILMGIGVIGRMWCSIYIAGLKNKRLITQGPYSICRNPLYLFSSIGAAGIGLGTETFTIPLLIISAFAVYYPFVIKNEQKKLLQSFGTKYSQYIHSTPSFFPKISCLTEPENYEISPIRIKRDFFSVIWFIWFFGLIALLVKMHQADILPMIIKLY